MGACLVAYVMNYIFGRITNGNIAQQWFENARSFLVRSLLSTIHLYFINLGITICFGRG